MRVISTHQANLAPRSTDGLFLAVREIIKLHSGTFILAYRHHHFHISQASNLHKATHIRIENKIAHL